MTTFRRQLKNVVKNYTEAEVKVREATSNDPWGPSSTLMSEISDLTYNLVALGEIMRMIWKRLNDHGKNWRHVYKSLVLLDYLIKNGNEKVAQQCKEHIVAIQTLKDFQHMEENRDQGSNVREKAKHLVALLRDDDRLKQERIKAQKARERYAQNAMGISSDNRITYATSGRSMMNGASVKTGGNYADPYGGARGGDTSPVASNLAPDLEAVRPTDATEEEIQINLAMMLSRQEHDEEEKRKKTDDAKLQLAIEQSQVDNGLVELGAGGGDPWADGDGLYPRLAVDPWIPPPNQKSGALVQLDDPWAGMAYGSKLSSNPWGGAQTISSSSSSSAQQATDPWAMSMATRIPTQSHVDDFSAFEKRSVSPLAIGNGVASNDPFGDLFAAPNGNGGTQMGALVTSMSNVSVSTNPWNEGNKESDESKPFALNGKKTPENFLGENSALVNLDNLIPARPKSTNPFGGPVAVSRMTPTASIFAAPISQPINSVSQAGVPNPFTQNQPKAPSIYQLQQQNGSVLQTSVSNSNLMFNGGNGGGFGVGAFPTYGSSSSPFGAQAAATSATATTNPFLMM